MPQIAGASLVAMTVVGIVTAFLLSGRVHKLPLSVDPTGPSPTDASSHSTNRNGCGGQPQEKRAAQLVQAAAFESSGTGSHGQETAAEGSVAVSWKNSVPVVRYVPRLIRDLKPDEHPCLLVFLNSRMGQPLNEEIASAAGDTILARSPIANRAISFTVIASPGSQNVPGYRFAERDTEQTRIRGDSVIEMALTVNGAQIDWGQFKAGARVWAAIGACRKDGDCEFRRFLSIPVKTDFNYPYEGRTVAKASEEPTTLQRRGRSWSLSEYILPSYSIVFAIRPMKIVSSPLLKAVPPESKHELDAALDQLRTKTGLPLEAADELIVASDGQRSLACATFRYPADVQSLLRKHGVRESDRYGNVPLYRLPGSDEWLAVPKLNTLLLANHIAIVREAIDASVRDAGTLDLPSRGDLVLQINDRRTIRALLEGGTNDQTPNGIPAPIKPTRTFLNGLQLPDFASNIVGLTCVAEFSEGLVIHATAATARASHAQELAAQLNGIKWALAAGFDRQKKAGQIAPGSAQDRLMSALFAQDFVVDQTGVRFTFTLDPEVLAEANARGAADVHNPETASTGITLATTQRSSVSAGEWEIRPILVKYARLLYRDATREKPLNRFASLEDVPTDLIAVVLEVKQLGESKTPTRVGVAQAHFANGPTLAPKVVGIADSGIIRGKTIQVFSTLASADEQRLFEIAFERLHPERESRGTRVQGNKKPLSRSPSSYPPSASSMLLKPVERPGDTHLLVLVYKLTPTLAASLKIDDCELGIGPVYGVADIHVRTEHVGSGLTATGGTMNGSQDAPYEGILEAFLRLVGPDAGSSIRTLMAMTNQASTPDVYVELVSGEMSGNFDGTQNAKEVMAFVKQHAESMDLLGRFSTYELLDALGPPEFTERVGPREYWRYAGGALEVVFSASRSILPNRVVGFRLCRGSSRPR